MVHEYQLQMQIDELISLQNKQQQIYSRRSPLMRVIQQWIDGTGKT